MASATEQKAETEIDLLRAIRTDISGLRAELNDIKAQVMNGHALPPQVPKLSQRQHAILERLCRGKSNKVIGRTLNLTGVDRQGSRSRTDAQIIRRQSHAGGDRGGAAAAYRSFEK